VRNESMNLSKNEMIMVMHDQEQEIEKLKSEVEDLKSKLEDYEIKISESGNLAEASAKVSGLFESAQKTVDTYLENIKKREDEANNALDDAQKKAEQIISGAEDVANKRLAAVDAEIEEKWAVIESRLLVMYESHKGLKELVESGIFTVPGQNK
jgi:cell division septum initiation protein DivIVA